MKVNMGMEDVGHDERSRGSREGARKRDECRLMSVTTTLFKVGLSRPRRVLSPRDKTHRP